MITNFIKKLFGTRNERILRNYRRVGNKVNQLEPKYQAMSDDELKDQTVVFKDRLAAGETLNDILPDAFAAVREAAVRTLGMRHFDVQLLGGMTLHHGKIAEMRTGEGKTLCSTLPCYLHALSGEGVHVVTVNDYLAERDANWMRPVFAALGLTVGINLSNMDHEAKQAAYAADITYGTNNEFGFDYLRDNMVFDLSQRVQRELNYAIIDEVDSILIDEARTPLIISGAVEQSTQYYQQVDAIIPNLKQQKMEEGQKEEEVAEEDKGDYTLDEKSQQAHLTEQGHQRVEELLVQAGLMEEGESLYDYKNIALMHFVTAALRAHTLFERDVHYVVKDNEVTIVDEHTGRLMTGRRWSDGLHQAIEAKERAEIQMENQTMATITFQNYFRIYKTLSGMTGTADTEAYEMQKIYGLEVVVIPTNKPMIRKDQTDQVYLTENSKYKAVVAAIKEVHETGQPILAGTASIEASEHLSELLKKAGIKHNVLNAKQHEREAKIIAQAGQLGAVTIATNMAGRGTDIVLGGNLDVEIEEMNDPTPEQVAAAREAWQKHHDEVIALGGLYVMCTERHESRRIDNQLRGRSGRQGDPGASRFYLSMEDNLMRIFASEGVKNMMQRFGFAEGDVIENKMITKAIEKAQRRVEGHHFDMRKNLLEYDDVANDQRKVIYDQRYKLLSQEDIGDRIGGLQADAIEFLMARYIPHDSTEEQWDTDGLEKQLKEDFNIELDIASWLESQERLDQNALNELILNAVTDGYAAKISEIDDSVRAQMEKTVMLQTLDHHWKEHLAAMDYLRKGIHLRSFAQKNPTQEYKKESFEMFENMLDVVRYEVVSVLERVQLQSPDDAAEMAYDPELELNYTHESQDTLSNGHGQAADQEEGEVATKPFVRGERKVGRNEPCPCGSGKKYKQCHGQLER